MQVFFGGPDRPGRLRDLLEERIDAVPSGGVIRWATYYFRDERLAASLIRAHRRGVRVRLAIEGAPRLRNANQAVIAMLADSVDGIGAGIGLVHRGAFRHLHEKLYCFSHPVPTALIGSFNPSGNEQPDPRVIRAIGDQDRGHNYLVALNGPVVAPLMTHVDLLHSRLRSIGQRFSRALNSPIEASEIAIYFFPRRSHPLDRMLSALPAGSRLRLAVSHLRDPGMARRLIALARRGVRVELLTEATERRVPRRIERRIAAGGIGFTRYRHPEELPMHSKFLLADGPDGRWTGFGSLNLTLTSRWLNHEIFAVSRDAALFDAFAGRWDEMLAEQAGGYAGP
ncbi:phospholipase D-like domain-containing protein [Flavisphingomonas formosensis]|uniref:phospholipase D-like domain-containing protein n=1 Tax=Flavisphingomonas formosensis TaxID=861534 RepID=UPI0012FABD88|nr:phospholipase D-like domain-containing protein [Sphingomonas formosensis]